MTRLAFTKHWFTLPLVAGTGAALTLDSTSWWTVTADSTLTTLTGAVISGSTITNITGNGHTVYYDKSTNTALGGKTYTLAGGGQLVPR